MLIYYVHTLSLLSQYGHLFSNNINFDMKHNKCIVKR